MQFDATEPRLLDTGVDRQQPLTGANAAVYDQWAKVGATAGQFALDVFEKRERAIAQNYTLKADSEMSLRLQQYQDDLDKYNVDGFIDGKSTSDLMNERIKTMSEDYLAKAPNNFAKTMLPSALTKTGDVALLNADKKFTAYVADASSRRVEDFTKASINKFAFDADYTDISPVLDELDMQINKEYGNRPITTLEQDRKKRTKDLYETHATRAISIKDEQGIKDSLLSLIGNKGFSTFIEKFDRTPSKIGIRQPDGSYIAIDTATGDKSQVFLSKDQFKEAPLVNISTGDTYDFNGPELSRVQNALTQDEANSWTSKLIDTYFDIKKKKKDNLTDEVNRYSKSLGSQPTLAFSPKVRQEKENLILKVMDSNQDIEDKINQLGKIAISTGGAVVNDVTKMTVSDMGNRSREQLMADTKEKSINQAMEIIKTLNDNGKTELAKAFEEKVKTDTYFDGDINAEADNSFTMQEKNKEDFSRDPIGNTSLRYRNEGIDQLIATNIFSKDADIESLLKLQTEKPKLALSMQDRQEELYQQASKLSVGAVREVLTKDQASELLSRIETEKDPVKLHDTLSKAIWLFKGDTKKFRLAMEQIKKPELASALALSKNMTTTLTILDAYSKGKAYEDAVKSLSGVKREDIKASIFKDKKFRAQYNALLSSSDPEGATRFHELVTDMALLVKARSGSTVPTDTNAAKYVSGMLFGDRELFSGNGGATLYDPKITSAEALEVTEENVRGLARYANIIVPENEEHDRYINNLSKTAQYKSIGDGLYAVKSTTVKDGVAVEDYVFIRNPVTGKTEYWTVTAEEINTYYAKLKASHGAAGLDIPISGQGTAGMFNPTGVTTQNTRSPNSAISQAGAGVLKPRFTPKGLASNVIGNWGDNDSHMRQVLFRETTSASPTLRAAGIPFGRSKRHGMDIPLTSFLPIGRPNDEANRQLAYGLTVRYADSILKDDPTWVSFKKNGYKFKTGTPEWQANKIDEWASKGYNTASKEAQDGMRVFLGLDYKHLSPQAYKVMAQLNYSEGQGAAFAKEHREVLKQALLNDDAYAMTKVLTKFKNYTINGDPLNAYGKMVLSWLIQ